MSERKEEHEEGGNAGRTLRPGASGRDNIVPTPSSVDTPRTFSTFPTQELARSTFPTQELSRPASEFPTQELSLPTSGTPSIMSTSSGTVAAAAALTRPGIDAPIITENVDLVNLEESQLIDYVRQAKAAYRDYFPEGCEPLVQTDRAMILLAKKVADSVFESRFMPIKARYFLDENLDLYIRKVPGLCHAAVHSEVTGHCIIWRNSQGLADSITVGDAANNNYAGKKLEPDVAIIANSDRTNGSPRCIIEIEGNHRSPREARELAAVYFQNPNVRCVVLLKMWSRRVDPTFAAACIVWSRGEDGVAIECRAAHDFGTAAVDAQARNNLSGANENPPLQFPFVPVDMPYTTPTPGRQPIADRTAQLVEIPASVFTVNATNERGEELAGLDPPVENLRLDLSVYVKAIERHLVV